MHFNIIHMHIIHVQLTLLCDLCSAVVLKRIAHCIVVKFIFKRYILSSNFMSANFMSVIFMSANFMHGHLGPSISRPSNSGRGTLPQTHWSAWACSPPYRPPTFGWQHLLRFRLSSGYALHAIETLLRQRLWSFKPNWSQVLLWSTPRPVANIALDCYAKYRSVYLMIKLQIE